jgi:hypothetical protein
VYIRHLILHEGSTITLDHVRVYYDTLTEVDDPEIEGGVTLIELLPCGQLLPVGAACSPSGAADCADGDVCTYDRCVNNQCDHEPIPLLYFGDTSFADGNVDVGDILCVLDVFGGTVNEACPMERADLTPCGGTGPDGNVDVGDILGVLDAFSGLSPCPNPCEP